MSSAPTPRSLDFWHSFQWALRVAGLRRRLEPPRRPPLWRSRGPLLMILQPDRPGTHSPPASAFFIRLRRQIALERFCHQLFEFLHAGQFVHVLQPKAQQEFLGGLVQNRTADHRLAPGGRDQLAIQQRRNDATGIHAANFADFRHRGRLLVSDDRQRFERGQRQADRRFQALGESARTTSCCSGFVDMR